MKLASLIRRPAPLIAAILLCVPPAASEPMALPWTDASLPNQFDLRFGAFAHGVGSVEFGTVDLSPELVFPRLPIDLTDWWAVLIPRAHIGGMGNLSNRTSYVYGGALWTFPLPFRTFAELFFDGATTNGKLQGDATHSALGCDPLFHIGGSLGYVVSPQWHAMLTIDHISNGNSTLGTGCKRNQGLNNYGVRIGYSF